MRFSPFFFLFRYSAAGLCEGGTQRDAWRTSNASKASNAVWARLGRAPPRREAPSAGMARLSQDSLHRFNYLQKKKKKRRKDGCLSACREIRQTRREHTDYIHRKESQTATQDRRESWPEKLQYLVDKETMPSGIRGDRQQLAAGYDSSDSGMQD